MDKVTHFELPADDVERAQTFYRKAFGWAMRPVPGMDYTLVSTTPTDKNGAPTDPGAINGGLQTRRAPVTQTVVTVSVADVDASLRTIEKLGGSVVSKKTAVGDMGFAAYFKDTEGNVLGLWQDAPRPRT